MTDPLDPTDDRPATGFSRPTSAYARDKSRMVSWAANAAGGLAVMGILFLYRITGEHDKAIALLQQREQQAELARQAAEAAQQEAQRKMDRRLERIEDGMAEILRFQRGLVH